MGMFDTVIINNKWLPESCKDSTSGDWQTKDLENLLLYYNIEEDGTLSLDVESDVHEGESLKHIQKISNELSNFNGILEVCNFIGENNIFKELSLVIENDKLISIKEINNY